MKNLLNRGKEMAGGSGTGKSGTATAQRTGGVVVPQGVTLRDTEQERIYEFNQRGTPVRFTLSEGFVDGATDVNFTVGGSFTRSGGGSIRDGAAIASRVRSIMRADAASRPDGFVYSAGASTADGLGARRARLYERVGFSRASFPGATQFAVVRNGVLTPSRR